MGGGATVPRDGGAYLDANGQPGKGGDGAVGSDTDVWIDASDFARTGKYKIQGPAPNYNTIECPQWLILAHELTTGHASQCVQGLEYGPNSKGMTAETYVAHRENRAIASEAAHREHHHLNKRPQKDVP
jgi:hypothetical protein